MREKGNTKEILQFVIVTAAFVFLLVAAFWLFQTLKGGHAWEYRAGSPKLYQAWAGRLAKVWRNWMYRGIREPAELTVGVLLCGFLEICREYAGILLFLL